MKYWFKGYKVFLYLLLCLFLTSCGDKSEHEIVKSSRDKNSYKYLTLENGLKVVVVSYPDTDTAAAALTVGIGSLDDPKERPGLAHYLEHMLFLGTKKYPESGEYQNFISKHGGSMNAFTASENTTYYFSINSDYLSDALDRFSQFFIAPLFNEEYVDRERHAVDSEYKMHMKNDGMRIFHALKQMINPKHPLSKFNIGNLETLSNEKKELRDDVKKFYAEKYDAYNMYLSIVGPQSIETLEQYAKSMFSSIKTQCPCPTATGIMPELFTSRELQKELSVKSLNDSKSLSLLFRVPAQSENYKNAPIEHIKYLLSTSDDGSLFKKLKEKNYIHNIDIGYSEFGKADGLFEIEFSLTNLGEKNKLEIIQDTFDYIAWLKQNGMQDWLYEQQKKIDIRSFEFSERAQPVGLAMKISTLLRKYPAQDILTINLLRPESSLPIKEMKLILSKLTPRNMNVLNVSSSVETDQKEKYFGTEYSIKDLDKSNLSNFDSKRSNDWSLPAENYFIPEKLDVLPGDESIEEPTLLSGNSESKTSLWYLNLSKFDLPQVEVGLQLFTPLTTGNPTNYAMSDLFTYILGDSTSTYNTMLSDAGVSISISNSRTGLNVHISSYRDNTDKAIVFALKNIMQASVTKDRFYSLKSMLLDRYKDYKNMKPFEIAMSEGSSILLKGSYTNEEILSALEIIDHEDFIRYSNALKSSFIKITGLVEGNINKSDVELYQQAIDHYLIFNKQLEAPTIENVSLTEGRKYWETYPSDKSAKALISFFPINRYDSETKAKLLLLGSIISSPFYDSLRTHQQVGYVVAARPNVVHKQLGLEFIIQSSSHDHVDLINRVADFILNEYKHIEGLSYNELESHKSSIKDNLLEKPKSISESFSDHWRLIAKEEYNFKQSKEVSEEVMKLSKEDILKFYKTILIENNTNLLIVNDSHNLKGIEKIDTMRGLS